MASEHCLLPLIVASLSRRWQCVTLGHAKPVGALKKKHSMLDTRPSPFTAEAKSKSTTRQALLLNPVFSFYQAKPFAFLLLGESRAALSSECVCQTGHVDKQPPTLTHSINQSIQSIHPSTKASRR